MKIYTDTENGALPIDEAVKVITDEWIEGGNHCHETVMNLRDALIASRRQLKFAVLKRIIDTLFFLIVIGCILYFR